MPTTLKAGSIPRTVFVSYSHRDAHWLSELQTVFKPLSVQLELWSDERIAPGSDWREQIRSTILSCHAAILLISADFLASTFIVKHELEPILEAANSRGVQILWIAISSSLVSETELSRYQALNDPAKPLDLLSEPTRRHALALIGKKVQEVLADLPTASDLPEHKRSKDPFHDLQVALTPVAEANLRTVGIDSNRIIDLLRAEFRSHPILRLIDYELSPRPLQHGYFVLITKSGTCVTVEHVSRCILPADQLGVWSTLCDAYVRAYHLPFRTDHKVLIRQVEYQRTLRVVTTLLESLTKYIYQSRIYNDEQVFPKFHRLKQDAENAFVSAEQAYASWLNDEHNHESTLGRVALDLDRTISAVHKIILEYHCPQ